MPFDINQLSPPYVAKIDGEAGLMPRLSVPVAESSPHFSYFELDVPMTLSEIAYELYGDFEVWPLLAAWNKIPTPGRYLIRLRFPVGYRILYMDVETYRQIVRLERFARPGLGQYSTDVSDQVVTIATASTLPDTGISDSLDLVEAGGGTFYRLRVW